MAGSITQNTLNTQNFRTVARALTLVENDLTGANDLLKSLEFTHNNRVIGITGPPGAGKSTLVNALIEKLLGHDKTVAVLAVDPTSPFNFGSLLGDRIRMAPHFNHPRVFIRSLATRGSLGGLSAKTIEMTDVLRAAGFDYILIETVGVGQSEVEIAGLADATLVVLVPEAGDEIQNIKSGLMEIAQAFVVNKADREGADEFAGNLKKITRQQPHPAPVFMVTALQGKGVNDVAAFIAETRETHMLKNQLLYQKAYKLIQQKRMANVDIQLLTRQLTDASKQKTFNLYNFIDKNY